jgi:hypothetical protein
MGEAHGNFVPLSLILFGPPGLLVLLQVMSNIGATLSFKFSGKFIKI